MATGLPIAEPRRMRKRRSTFFSPDALLLIATLLALWRGTSMWYGYPARQDEIGLVNPLPMQLMLYALGALTAVYLLTRPLELIQRIRHASPLLLVFLSILTISILFSIDPMVSIRAASAVALISLPMLLFRWRFGLIKTMELIRVFSTVAIFINLSYAVIFPEFGIMRGEHAGSLRGMFLHKNIFGQFAAISFLIAWPNLRLTTVSRRTLLWRLFTAVMALASCFLSRSSTSVIMVVIGMLSLAMMSLLTHVRGRLNKGIAIVILFALCASIFQLGPEYTDLLSRYSGKDLTFSGRTDLWAQLWPHVFDYPVTGHGFGMLRQPDYIHHFVNRLTWTARSTHNTYLEILLNIGFVGGVIWMLILISRVISKALDDHPGAIARAANNRQISVLLMIMVGSLSEAGQMLMPLVQWCVVAAFIPYDSRAAKLITYQGRSSDSLRLKIKSHGDGRLL